MFFLAHSDIFYAISRRNDLIYATSRYNDYSMPPLGINDLFYATWHNDLFYAYFRDNETRYLIFVSRDLTSWPVSVRSHRVTGITLPSVDATFFRYCFGLARTVKKRQQ